MAESNNLLKETQESIKSITAKANDFFRILLIVLFGLIGYFFGSSFPDNHYELAYMLTSLIALFPIGYCTFKFFKIIAPKSVFKSGSEPMEIIKDCAKDCVPV